MNLLSPNRPVDIERAAFIAFLRGLLPDPSLTVDEWSDQFMVIPKSTGSNEAGPYRTSRTPHARAVMRALSANHPCKRVVVMGASQMLKTQVALNFLCCTIHQSPSNFLWLVPTGKLHKRTSSRIDKTFAAVPKVTERVAKPGSRDAAYNNDVKEYIGGALYIASAGAAANLSELPARYVVYDEIDRSEANIGGEGDPGELAEARQTTFERNRKTYYPSSPTIEGQSPIKALYDRGTRREALAECIHCGHAQPLDFFKLIPSEDGKRVYYPCQSCGGLHDEGDKTRMFANGLWTEGVEGDNETESFNISAMFLPYGWLPWIGLWRQYQRAKEKLEEGDDASMIVFYNTRLAKCWSRTAEATQWEELKKRAEPYKLGTVPHGATILTAATDTQDQRLECKVVGWGEDMQGWIVDYQVIHGSPSDASTWARLDHILTSRYPHATGVKLGISAALVDSGGHFTQDVYAFTGPRKARNIYACKGHSKPNRPVISGKASIVDINHEGKSMPGGAMLWFVGPDTCKDYFHARWSKASGPGAIHFSVDLPDSYYKGLTAEVRITVRKNGRANSVWSQKKGEANEPLDLMNYNLAAAHYLGLHRFTPDQWRRLRESIIPSTPDLFTQPEPVAAPAAPQAIAIAKPWHAPNTGPSQDETKPTRTQDAYTQDSDTYAHDFDDTATCGRDW